MFDKVEEFKADLIQRGLYYVETVITCLWDATVGNNMICYCLEIDIIKLDKIKYVLKSSLSLAKYYYYKFIDYC